MYSVAVHIKFPDGTHRTDYATGNTKRTCEAAANAVARMERLEGNEVALSLPRKERG